MKLRIQEDSIRLRLAQGEVQKLQRDGYFLSKTAFSGQTLNYELIGSKDYTSIQAEFKHNKISIQVPGDLLMAWASTDQVTLENTDQSQIRILIEKDFQCLHKRVGEDESDNFPNPLAANQP